MSFNTAPVMALSVVAVDVGKNRAALSMTSADRRRLFGPNRPGFRAASFLVRKGANHAEALRRRGQGSGGAAGHRTQSGIGFGDQVV